ncbi:CorA-like magnesium transporter protein [Ceratobasidium sp. AG-Ba]|nr:CorA-like magnesium transporter protein [Ceratobasidium sp. AG-Ba]
MPKSNSDADENESLTSDEETTSPTRATFAPGPAPRSPQSPRSPRPMMSPVGSHRFSRVQSRRPTMPPQREPSRINPLDKPIDQFRSVVRAVMQMNKTHVALKDLTPGVGADLQRGDPYELYGHHHQDCKVHVWDYGPTKARPLQFQTNHDFIEWLESDKSERGLWSKVRWINISGLSWDILGVLKQKYDLHPLSLDVVFHARNNSRSKADYYAKHLFIHILSHSLPPDESNPKTGAPLPDEPDPIDSPRQSKTYDPEQGLSVNAGDVPYGRARASMSRRQTMMTTNTAYNEKELDLVRTRTRSGIHPNTNVEDPVAKAARKKEANLRAIDALKAGDGQIKVDVASIFMFLLRDGTLITIQREPEREFAQPIYARLQLRDTLLRSSGDASLLLQSLIDMIVDDAVKVTDKYHRRLLKMERDILLKPKMKTVRDLHIASEDLTLHKRTMGPISQLVYGLRRYDADRAKAVATEAEKDLSGFLSHQAKVYLADVHDHIEYILSSLDMFSSIAENLISYTFNIVSYETNQVMRGLTIATVIFFPLTFLTGYFGMNFHVMHSVQDHSEAMFWEIAGPVMFVVIGLFLWPDIARLIHFLKKRAATKRFDVKAKKMN